ncbi:MAG: response regulator [Xylophilus ampelinus]
MSKGAGTAKPTPAHGWRRFLGPWTARSLQSYFVAVILLTSLPIAFGLGWQVVHDTAARRAAIEAQLQSAAQGLAQRVDRELRAAFDALQAMAYAMPGNDRSRLDALFRTRMQVYASWHSVFVADAQGRVLMDTAPSAESVPGLEELARRVLARGTPQASGLQRGGDGAHVLLAVPAPAEGGVRQVVGVRSDRSSWLALVEGGTVPAGEFLRIFDGDRWLIAGTGEGASTLGWQVPEPPSAPPTAGDAPDGPPGVRRTTLFEGGEALTAWRALREADWGVSAGIPAEPIEQAERDVLLQALTTAGLALLLGISLALLLARHVTRPLRAMALTGTAPLDAPFAVREIAVLREALRAARGADQAAHAALHDKQALIDLVQDAGHAGFLEFRFHVDEMMCSKGMAHLLGLPAGATWRGRLRDWLAAVHPDDRRAVCRRLAGAMARQRAAETFDFRGAGGGAAARWLSLRVRLEYRVDGRPSKMVGVAVDATEYKEAERSHLRQAERENAARQAAEQASEAKDEFLMMLGHELRNPLGAISAASEVLATEGRGDPLRDRAVSIVLRQTERLTRILDKLLDATHAVRGTVELAIRPTSLGPVVERARERVEAAEGLRRHRVALDLEPARVLADPLRMEQVVAQLLINAVRHTPEGTPVTLQVRAEGGRGVLRVCDAGPGIPEELRAAMFGLFVQGQRTLARSEGGLGVGLALVRRLVVLQGGEVSADSGPGGSVFTVSLPLAEGRGDPAGDAAPAAPDPSRPAPLPRRILLVEDHEDARLAVSAMLEVDGHAVATADEGEAGLRLLLDDWPDIAIVDIGLPGIDGLELARRARAHGFPGRMVAMSGYGRARTVQDARRAGFDLYLVKPVTVQRLREAMDEKRDAGTFYA